MASIDTIVKVDISLSTQVAPQAGFGIPLIMGTTGFGNSDLIRYYTSASAMLSDGFTTSSPEYIRALAATSQALVPLQFGIGKYTAPVIQVSTGTPDTSSQQVQHYIATISGVAYDYTSDSTPTAAEVVTGLTSLINADSNAPCTASGSTTIILTAKVAGAGFTVTGTTNLPFVTGTPNHSISDDIAALQLVSDAWYGLNIVSQLAADIEQVAAYIESQKKIFVADSHDAAIITTSTSDVASVLKGKGYNRTALMYAGTANDGRAAAWLGGQLPQTPGASTWKFKQLVSITPDVFTATQRSIAIGNTIAGVTGKNCNIYETVGGANITEEGFMVSGRFIDLTVGVDWMQSTCQTNIYSLLVGAPKIPYTDQGASIVENAVRQMIGQGILNGLIDGNSPIVVTIPPVLQQTPANRANRVLANVNFSCRLAGALHFVVIQGTVTV